MDQQSNVSTNRTRIAVCNLSRLSFVENEAGGTRRLKDAHEFTFRDDQGCHSYLGIQTNQAPVKCIIERACKRDEIPVTTLVNLFSPECEAPHSPYINELGEEDLRTDECYFVDSIVEYCEENNLPCPENFERIPYDTGNPATSLEKLISVLNQPGAIVDVDTTGGLRDAATLITLALQTIKTRPESAENGITMGRIVYANLQNWTISIQDETYSLVDMSNAISAFTSYGKADQLSKYFEERSASPTTKRLCEELRVFSNKMSLCNTELRASVERINKLLNKLEKAPKDELGPSELLFVTLIPMFREGFVKTGPDLVVNLIEWCVERQMLQQALALIRERIPEYLASSSIIELRNGAQPKELEQLCLGKNWDGCDFVNDAELDKVARSNSHRARLCMTKTTDFANEEYVSVAQGYQSELAGALVWFRYLWLVRNTVMHAGGTMDVNPYKYFLREFKGKYGKRLYLRVSQNGTQLVPQAQTAENLTTDLNTALGYFKQAGRAKPKNGLLPTDQAN